MKTLFALIVVLTTLPAAAGEAFSGAGDQPATGQASPRRQWAGEPNPGRQPQRLRPPSDRDCVRFDPAAAVVRRLNSRWTIVHGDHRLFDVGGDRTAAESALAVIRHYRLDRVCFVGRPEPALVYLLARGGVPSGEMNGEDCLAFDPGTIRLERIGGQWTISAGGRRLSRLGRNASAARRALAAIRHHGFTHLCFVGRVHTGFTYWRR